MRGLFRKIITVLAVVVLACSFAVACSTPAGGGGGDNNGEGGGGTTPQAPPKPVYTREGEFVYFGSYPQTIKRASVIIPESDKSKGSAVGSDGKTYRKKVVMPYSGGNGYKFSNGDSLVVGATEYFLVEKLKWRVLEEKDGALTLISCSIIDCKAFDNSNNDYAESSVRAWLNGSFMDLAFTEREKSAVLDTTVDNSPISTGYETNDYACEDTIDKVFLPSRADVTNPAYGFYSDLSVKDGNKQATVTDYALAVGAWMNTGSGVYGYGWWWLRSPVSTSSVCAQYATSGGSVAEINKVSQGESGIVPMIRLAI